MCQLACQLAPPSIRLANRRVRANSASRDCGDEHELVVSRDRVYELDGEDSRTLAVIGTFRVVPEQDLETVTTPCAHLRDEGLVDTVDLGRDERVLTKERAEHAYSKCRRAKERPEPDFR